MKLRLAFLAGIAIAVAASVYYFYYYRVVYERPPIPEGVSPRQVLVRIPKGASLNRIADSLAVGDVIKNREDFIMAARYLDYETKLKAGVFLIDQYLSHKEILEIINGGLSFAQKVTLPEGKTISQIAGILRRTLGLDSANLVSLCFDPDFVKSLGLDAASLEGYLAPETYQFDVDISEKDAIQQMKKLSDTIFSDSVLAVNASASRYNIRKIGLVQPEEWLNGE